MLLVLDVGNTNTVLGVFEERAEGSNTSKPWRLISHWRVTTNKSQTVDEYGVLFRNLFAMNKIEVSATTGIVISSVVPPLDSTLREVCERYFQIKPLFIEPGVKTGMPVHYDNPAEVGADRIVNSVAAYEKFGGPSIVVDFGTATTFDVVSPKGEYLGGIITPGAEISIDALYDRAAKLPKVELAPPRTLIGKNTVDAIRSGIVYGFAGQVEGIVRRLRGELGPGTCVIATGGLAAVLVPFIRETIDEVDDLLTLTGLRLIYERNRP